MNDATTPATAREGEYRPRTAWELSELIRPVAGPRSRGDSRQRRRLKPYYPQIVLYVFRSRFATGYQIARRFPEHLPSERTMHRRLAHMVELGVLETANVRSTAPYFPHVYLATAKGIRWVKRIADQQGLTFTVSAAEEKRERGRALDSILHELLLTELDLAAHQTVRSRGDLSLPMTERRYYRQDRRLTFTYQGVKRHLIPDAGFLLGVKRQGSAAGGTSPNADFATLFHAVEMDNATMSLPRFLDKLRHYELWSLSEQGQQYLVDLYRQHGASNPRASFRLLIVCHDKAKLHSGGDQRRQLDLFIQCLELSSEMRDRIWMTTVDHLRRHQSDDPPLAAPLWLRVRDARRWMQEYRTYVASLPRSDGQKAFHAHRQFWTDRLAQLPLHPLFPRPA